jgi:hypothetical protein
MGVGTINAEEYYKNGVLLNVSCGTDIDTRCDTSGTCSQVCIGSDCRTSWPESGITSCSQCDSRFINEGQASASLGDLKLTNKKSCSKLYTDAYGNIQCGTDQTGVTSCHLSCTFASWQSTTDWFICSTCPSGYTAVSGSCEFDYTDEDNTYIECYKYAYDNRKWCCEALEYPDDFDGRHPACSVAAWCCKIVCS